MGARLGHVAVTVVLLLSGCSNRLSVPAHEPAERHTSPLPAATSIPEPTPSPAPYVNGSADVRKVAGAFVFAALEYDAMTESAVAFLERVAPVTTLGELERL